MLFLDHSLPLPQRSCLETEMLYQEDPALVGVPSNSDFVMPQPGQHLAPSAFLSCPPHCIPHLTQRQCLMEAGTPLDLQGKPADTSVLE